MELLTIFYAMLAALTGISVGENTPARSAEMGCTAAALISEVASAEAQQRVVASRPSAPIAALQTFSQLQTVVTAFPAAPQRIIAWIDLGRRHL